QHMARLLDDLLDVSRIIRGKILLHRARLDLSRLVGDTAEDHRGALRDAGLTLTLELPEGPVWVVGDPTRLSQVLENLLQNAGKFTDPGGAVTVRLSVVPIWEPVGERGRGGDGETGRRGEPMERRSERRSLPRP